MIKDIEAFIEDDFVSKLTRGFFQNALRQTSEAMFKEKLEKFLKNAILQPSKDICSDLTLDVGFNSNDLNLLRSEYKALKESEQLDDATRRRIWKAFEGLLENVDPDKYLTGSKVEVAEEQPMDQGSEQMEDSEDSSPIPIFPRRRITLESPLPDLYTDKGKKGVKKEFFRCQHIRAEKKAMRLIERNKQMKKGICPIDPEDLQQIHQWTQLVRIFEHGKKVLPTKSKTSSETRSFNNQFCFSFYSSEKVRLFHYKFSDLVYKREPAELCTNISTKCCLEKDHTEECKKLWEKVRTYVKFSMLEELGFQRDMLEKEDAQEI